MYTIKEILEIEVAPALFALSSEQTTRNVGQISTEGMIETDRTILRIMMDKQFEEA